MWYVFISSKNTAFMVKEKIVRSFEYLCREEVDKVLNISPSLKLMFQEFRCRIGSDTTINQESTQYFTEPEINVSGISMLILVED